MKQVVDGVEWITGVRARMRDGCELVAEHAVFHAPATPSQLLLTVLPDDPPSGNAGTTGSVPGAGSV
jgi:hypothetical protein